MVILSACIYKCNNSLTAETALKCDACSRPFHAPCAGISRNEELQLKAPKRKIIFHCLECSTNKTDLTAITNILEIKLNEIKMEIATLKQSSLNSEPKCLLIEDVISEMEERKKRSKNIMIFKLPELVTENLVESELHDTKFVTNLLSNIQTLTTNPPPEDQSFDINEINNFSASINTTVINNNSSPLLRTFRVGKPVPGQPRPLKVVMDSESTVLSILKNKSTICRNLKIGISRDNTPNQQQALNEIRQTLEKRKADGENDITIRYINGSPKIVKEFQKNSTRNPRNYTQ